jgi:hypothetical protein
MKKKQRNILILGALVAAALVAFFSFTIKPASCTTLLPTNQSNELIDKLDKDAGKFASTTKDISGQSAEGGQQIDFKDKGKRQIVEQRFYGETGKSYARFYYFEGRIFAVTKLNVIYKVPIYVDSSAEVKSAEKKDFYLNKNGVVCNWYLNDSLQSVDRDVTDMIAQYISGIAEQ